jgi:choline monooxygenase
MGASLPFDPAELEVDPDIRRAESLPAWAFTDPAFARREMEAIFARTWQLVPERATSGDDPRRLADALSVRGARVPIVQNGRPLFLQRGWEDSELRLFPNTCTHAWHPLVAGPSRGNTIACPQHGRKFDCRGRFVSQPGFAEAPDFPRACDHLQAFPVEAWREFLFACLGSPAVGLDEALQPLEETIAALPLEHARLRSSGREARELDGNWKQHAWNYMDRFHVSFIHRAPGGLADAIELGSYRTELHPWVALQWAYARNPEHGFPSRALPARFADPERPERRVFALWWFVFPNLTLNLYPWGLSVNVYQPLPESPAKTRFLWYHLVADEELYRERDRIWMLDAVDREDVEALSQVGRALRSGVAPRGRFAPSEETGPHWFHRLVSRLVLEPAS